MDMQLLSALALFAFVTSITPGPNNLMLMASGANYWFRRSVPHMLGIGVGFTVMLVLVGAGLAGIFDTVPRSRDALRAASAAYLLWLAWKTASAAGFHATGTTGRPLGFVQAAAFQWVNPKAWAMALTAMTVYAPGRDAAAILAVALVFGSINLPSVSLWTVTGQQIACFLTSDRRRLAFNVTMALLLVASLAPLLRP